MTPWSQYEGELFSRALLDPSQWADVVLTISADDLSTPVAQDIFREISTAHAAGDYAHATIIAKRLEPLHGMATATEILRLANYHTATNQAAFARSIREDGRKRALRRAASAVLSADDSMSADDMAAALARSCEALDASVEQALHLVDAMEPMYRFADKAAQARALGRTIGVPTGIPYIDQATSGFCEGELVVVAARTSVGKTAFVNQCCLHAAGIGDGGLIVSLEEQYEGIAMRAVAATAGIKIGRIRHGRESSSSLRAAVDGTNLGALPIWVSTSAHRLSQITALIGAYRRKYRIRWAVIDHLGLVDVDTANPRAQRYEKVGHLTSSCKRLAQALGIPIILVCQISRAGAAERPDLIHLRESGNIEQDANTIIALHRVRQEGPTNAAEPPPVEVEIGVLKARYGSVGWGPMYQFDGSFQRFAPRHG